MDAQQSTAFSSNLRAPQQWRKTKVCCSKDKEHFYKTVKKQGKWCWDWGGMTMLRTWAGSFLHHRPSLDTSVTITLGFQGHSAFSINYFALDFARANISTLHQHIVREIKSCICQCYYWHQNCPIFIQWGEATSSTMLDHLQLGCSGAVPEGAVCKRV